VVILNHGQSEVAARALLDWSRTGGKMRKLKSGVVDGRHARQQAENEGCSVTSDENYTACGVGRRLRGYNGQRASPQTGFSEAVRLTGRWVAMATLLVSLSFGGLLASEGLASAATTPGYPTAQVEVGASTRTVPFIESSDYWGYALPNPGSSYWLQTVSVLCWYDGSWATGNYYTNRWFKVLVWESYDGYATPRWLFVHASYVFNQPSVRECVESPTGYW